MVRSCMRLSCFLALLIISGSSLAMEHVWSLRFVGSDDENRPRALCVDANDAVIVGGSYYGTVDAGGGDLAPVGQGFPPQAYLAKIDADGAHVWSRGFAAEWFYSTVEHVMADTLGNVYAVIYGDGSLDLGGGPIGSSDRGHFFLVKYDPAGAHLWSRDLDFIEVGGVGTYLDVTASGRVVLTGRAGTDLDAICSGSFTYDEADFLVVVLDAAGGCESARLFTGSGAQYGVNVSCVDERTVWVTGAFENTVDFGLGPMTSPGGEAYVLLRLDTIAGTTDLVLGLPTCCEQTVAAADGSVYLCGWRYADIDFGGGPLTDGEVYVAKLDAVGGHVWSRAYDGAFEETPRLGLDAADRPSLTGAYESALNIGGVDLPDPGETLAGLYAVLDASDGGYVTAAAFVADQSFQGCAGCVLSTGDLVLAGLASYRIDLGGGPLVGGISANTGSPVYDTVLARYSLAAMGWPVVQWTAVDGLVVPAGASPLEDVLSLPDHYWDPETGDGLSFAVVGNSDTDLVTPVIDAEGGLDLSFHPILNGTAFIEIEAADGDGRTARQIFTVVVEPTSDAETPPGPITRFAAAPNPFNPRTTIAFELGAATTVDLSIFDAAGRRVRSLIAGEVRAAGGHEVVWDGRDAFGRAAAAGIYLCRLEAGGASVSLRISLVK